MRKSIFKRITACIVCAATMWMVVCSADASSLTETVQAMTRQINLPKSLLQWELSNLGGTDSLPLSTLLTIRQSPTLLSARTTISQQTTAQEKEATRSVQEDTGKNKDEESHHASAETPKSDVSPSAPKTTLTFKDNGMPCETVIPKTAKGYTTVNGVLIKNASTRSISKDQLLKKSIPKLSDEGPQVLIIHTHGSEAYTMPEGEKYRSTGTCRTSNMSCNMIRIGDEFAAVLSSYGISVLHDRVLYDNPDYNVAYERCETAIKEYLEKYPSIRYVLDIHRDAIEDISGKQYKLVTKEDPHAAQVSIVMGSDYDAWQTNLHLAVAVQKQLMDEHPTLMRPITVRNYPYNQDLCTGSLLVEIGAAGNSLDEALYAAQWFAKGFAETLLATADQ